MSWNARLCPAWKGGESPLSTTVTPWHVEQLDSTTNKVFLQLLSGKRARPWTALLLSGLGNDVISATMSPPTEPSWRRLLCRAEEWGLGSHPSRYVSEAGWETFRTHAKQVFDILLTNRDRTEINRSLPIVLHTYDYTTPRNAGAGLNFVP